MLNLQVINAHKVYAWRSEVWPVAKAITGEPLSISGEVTENYEFQIRSAKNLNVYLSNKSSEDVSQLRRAIRIKLTSAKDSKGKDLTYTQLTTIFKQFVATTNEDLEYTCANNTLDIWAPATVIGDLRGRIEGVTTPLYPGTKLTILTDGSTPFCQSHNIVVDKAFDVSEKFQQKNVDVEEGMLDFARKYQALTGSAENKKVAQSDDDEWD